MSKVSDNCTEKPLDAGIGVEKGRYSLIVRLQWLLLRVFLPGYGIKLHEVERRSYECPGNELTKKIESAKAAEPAMDLAKALFSHDEERCKAINEKTRLLLSVCPLLVALFGLLLSRLTVPWLGIAPLLCFMLAVLILLINLGTGTRSVPDFDESMLQLEVDACRRNIAASYYLAAHINGYATDFLVDVYRAGRRAFAIGMLAIVALLVFSLVYKKPEEPLVIPAPTVNVAPIVVPAPVVNIRCPDQPAPIVNIHVPPVIQSSGADPSITPTAPPTRQPAHSSEPAKAP